MFRVSSVDGYLRLLIRRWRIDKTCCKMRSGLWTLGKSLEITHSGVVMQVVATRVLPLKLLSFRDEMVSWTVRAVLLGSPSRSAVAAGYTITVVLSLALAPISESRLHRSSSGVTSTLHSWSELTASPSYLSSHTVFRNLGVTETTICRTSQSVLLA